ncbi:DUF2512 family protein [Brevibacillus sp. SYP-B805]|uniref:DUF2512 family protein n=1 Tax=Brevibacillus sp. SYP-B805 TaxID=1578199 RepID=UPI0013EA994D|nr:DUF2512 family protein [Brevibacillus sp. SYP-B805]NGQ94195.1 DUF2512 family protein [Brevibacillus sp. SYP-B805]
MTLLQRAGVNLGYKLLVFPALIWGFAALFPGLIRFATVWQPIAISGLFILTGLIADETILPRAGNLPATFQGFLFMTAVLWASQFLFSGSRVTGMGALALGLLLGMAELCMHRWILQQREKQEKSS